MDEDDEERIFLITTEDLQVLEFLESFLSGVTSLDVEDIDEFSSLLSYPGMTPASACHDCLVISLPPVLLSTTCSVGQDLDAL